MTKSFWEKISCALCVNQLTQQTFKRKALATQLSVYQVHVLTKDSRFLSVLTGIPVRHQHQMFLAQVINRKRIMCLQHHSSLRPCALPSMGSLQSG